MHQHKNCKLVFVAGAPCIRKHFLNINPACGIVKCTAEAALEPVLDDMTAWARRCLARQQQHSASLTALQ